MFSLLSLFKSKAVKGPLEQGNRTVEEGKLDIRLSLISAGKKRDRFHCDNLQTAKNNYKKGYLRQLTYEELSATSNLKIHPAWAPVHPSERDVIKIIASHHRYCDVVYKNYQAGAITKEQWEGFYS